VFKFIEKSSLTDKARLIAFSAPKTRDWLKVIPFEWELSLRDLFLPTLGLYLGLEISASLRSECLCSCEIDKLEIHLLTCRYGGGVILRHDEMRDEGCSIFQELLEPTACCQIAEIQLLESNTIGQCML